MLESKSSVLPVEWAELIDIDEVSPLNHSDEKCLAEIREVLLKYKKTDRFGVSLIHKHFDLGDDEILMEFCDIENRVLTTKPVKKTDVSNSIETVWYFGNGKERPARACYRSCWTDIHGNHNGNHQWGP